MTAYVVKALSCLTMFWAAIVKDAPVIMSKTSGSTAECDILSDIGLAMMLQVFTRPTTRKMVQLRHVSDRSLASNRKPPRVRVTYSQYTHEEAAQMQRTTTIGTFTL
jgi:hypothetical protein